MCKEINNLDDFKEWAKTITREDFIKNYLEIENDSVLILANNFNKYVYFTGTCPKRINDKLNCSKSSDCTQCWINSVKDIRFKYEYSVGEYIDATEEEKKIIFNKSFEKIYDKEFNIIDIYSFNVGTKFYCIDMDENVEFKSIKNSKKELLYIESQEPFEINSLTIGCKFKLLKEDIIKQITFADTYKLENKDNLFMVEHDLIKDDIFMEDELEYLFSYESLDVLLNKLTNVVDYKELIEVINNGKWTMKVMNG